MAAIHLEMVICWWRCLSVSQSASIYFGPTKYGQFVNTKFVDYLILKNGTCKPWQTNSIMRIVLFSNPILCKRCCNWVFWPPIYRSHALVMTPMRVTQTMIEFLFLILLMLGFVTGSLPWLDLCCTFTDCSWQTSSHSGYQNENKM